MERLVEIMDAQNEGFKAQQVEAEEELAPIVVIPKPIEVKEEKPKKKHSKKRTTATPTPAKNLTVFDFTDTPPSQKPAKKERKRTGSLSGTTFFIYGTFSLPRRTIETLITMEGGSISKTLSAQVW